MKALSLSKEKIRFVLLEGIHAAAAEVLAAHGYSNVVSAPAAANGRDLRRLLAGAHFLGIRSRTQLGADALGSARRLTAIGCFCIGTNQVDLEAAAQLGIPVFNAPFSNTRSVAELVLAEIIMLLRGIPAKNAAAHRGQWLKGATGAVEARGKVLGIVGYGHIGSQLGVLAEGLGMRVRYYDVVPKLPLGNAQPCPSLEALLDVADVVSLHVPETPETRGMIDAPAIARMRDGACLINASRGHVVVIEALAEALAAGKLGGAAVDVFPHEPESNDAPFTSPLCALDNVLLTPHIGGSTQEAQRNIAEEVATKLIRYSDNGSTVSAVNFPEVSLPDARGRHRLLHVHRNEPGVLREINQVFADSGVNVAAQYLQTRGPVGYVVMDLEVARPQALMARLRAVHGTIRTRILY